MAVGNWWGPSETIILQPYETMYSALCKLSLLNCRPGNYCTRLLAKSGGAWLTPFLRPCAPFPTVM